MARNRLPSVTRLALLTNLFILGISGGAIVFNVEPLAAVVNAMGMGNAVSGNAAGAVFALGVGCAAGLAAGATGGGPATGAVPLIAVFAFHATAAYPLFQGGAKVTDSAVITHAGAGLLALAGFLAAHLARWGGVVPGGRKSQ